jgi:non-specific protein-tyrosine kinase
MDLHHYLNILARRKWLILVTMLSAVAVAATVTLRQLPIYEASSVVRAAQTQLSRVDYWNLQYAELLKNTYAQIVVSPTSLKQIIQDLGLTTTATDLAGRIAIEAVPQSELVRITAESPDPQEAMAIADRLGELMVDLSLQGGTGQVAAIRQEMESRLVTLNQELQLSQLQLRSINEDLTRMRQGLPVSQLEAEMEGELPVYLGLLEERTAQMNALEADIQLKEQARVALMEQYQGALIAESLPTMEFSLVQRAISPLEPVRPRLAMNLALAFLVGFVGGVGLALVWDNLDTTLYSADDIVESSELPLLGEVPQMRKRSEMISLNGNLPQGEAFRRLRVNILAREPGLARQKLMVTSAEPKEGKSTIAANLARALALAGDRVILVDGDLRMPVLHRIFDLPNVSGLSSVLRHEAGWQTVVQHSRLIGLDVLTSGPLPHNPSELLGSATMVELLEALGQAYDIVLVDTPAVLAVADAAVLAPMMDGVLVVASRALTSEETIRAARQQLVTVSARPIGVVVNRSSQDINHRYYTSPAKAHSKT